MKLNLSLIKTHVMIRYIFIFVLSVMLTRLNAQDDYYYDPANDHTLNNYTSSQTGSTTTVQDPANFSNADRTDGYGNADSYTQRDANGNTTIINNYYDDDELNDFYYTNRVRRFYSNTWGVDYYSYVFTPSYYYGWNTWNAGWGFGRTPWHSHNWWRWNRHPWQNTVVYYDPWYDPFWSYNWGWNTMGFYNINYFPSYSFCGTPYVWNMWGGGYWGCNNGWGWGNGWCGNGGWNNGYWNGYNNGYWNGYNDGYNDGYWSNPYAWNNGGWGGGLFFKEQPSLNQGKVNVSPASNNPLSTMEIPREGIVKPLSGTVSQPVKTIDSKGNTTVPSVVNTKPSVDAPTGVISKGADKYSSKTSTEVKPIDSYSNANPSSGIGTMPANPGSGKGNAGVYDPKTSTSPKPMEPNVNGKPTPGVNPSNTSPNINKGNPGNYDPYVPVKPYEPNTQKPNVMPGNTNVSPNGGKYDYYEPKPSNNNWNNTPAQPSTPPVQPRPRDTYERPDVNYTPKPVNPRNESPVYERPNVKPAETPKIETQPNRGYTPRSSEGISTPRNDGYKAPSQQPREITPAPSQPNRGYTPKSFEGGSAPRNDGYKAPSQPQRDYSPSPRQQNNYSAPAQPRQYNAAPSPQRQSGNGGSIKRF